MATKLQFVDTPSADSLAQPAMDIEDGKVKDTSDRCGDPGARCHCAKARFAPSRSAFPPSLP